MAEAAEEKMAVPVVTGVPLKLVIMIVVGTLLIGLGGAFVFFRMTGGSKGDEGKAQAESHGNAAAPAESHDNKAGHGTEPARAASKSP